MGLGGYFGQLHNFVWICHNFSENAIVRNDSLTSGSIYKCKRESNQMQDIVN